MDALYPNPAMSNNWRASLVPAAAVIPAPRAYTNIVAVKKLVVDPRAQLGRGHAPKENKTLSLSFGSGVRCGGSCGVLSPPRGTYTLSLCSHPQSVGWCVVQCGVCCAPHGPVHSTYMWK